MLKEEPMGFFEQVRQEAQPIWDRVLEHPFIRGLADGTLPEETFRYYVGQDTKYLVQYARARAAGIVKASDPATMLVFAEGVNYVLAGETSFHQRSAAFFGQQMADFLQGEMAPTNRAYTDYLLGVAYTGTLAELVAASLPCPYGYGQVAERLLSSGLPDHPLYAGWIQHYSSDALQQKRAWFCELFDHLAARGDAGDRARMTEHYLTCSRYEWMFFDMAWRRETWPI
jgi:thiaminase (transcriptional activator TenA)